MILFLCLLWLFACIGPLGFDVTAQSLTACGLLNQTACATRPDCLFFTLTRKGTTKKIGCLAVPITNCGLFWTKKYCQSANVSDSCTWTSQKKCILTSSITFTPSLSPSSPTLQPSVPPTFEGSSCNNYTAAVCALYPGCALYNKIKTCDGNGLNCRTYNYGCQDTTTFCSFQGLYQNKQCGKFPTTCWWDSTLNQCVRAVTTTSPTTQPPTPSPTCQNALTNDDCDVLAQTCTWIGTFKECNLQGQSCYNVAYGCQDRQFCAFNRGHYPITQCAKFGYCFFDLASSTCELRPITSTPTILPTAYPTTPTPTTPPTHSPTTSPTGHPSLGPTDSPTGHPTRGPTRTPSKAPITSKPSRTPSKSPTRTPSTTPSGSPSLGPSFSPTFSSCLHATDLASCTTLAGSDGRCEWIAPRACNTKGKACQTVVYGCQERGFCNMSMGLYPRTQCLTRPQFCVWNTTVAACLDPCQEAPPVGPHLRTMCAVSTIPVVSVSGRSIRFGGTNAIDHAGDAVAGDGDFDGDGRIDVVIASPDAPPKITGRAGTGNVNLLLESLHLTDRSTSPRQTILSDAQFRINGTFLEGQFGAQVLFVDLDGDKLADLVVSAPYASPLQRVNAGQVYIIWGRTDFAAAWANGVYSDLESLPADVVLRIPGEVSLQTMGSALSRAGDFDGDGYQDLAIGARDSSPGQGRAKSGEVFILYGRQRALFGSNPLTISQTRLTRIQGQNAFDYMGSSVGGGQDVNNDGYADIITGAPWAGTPSGTGTAYVIFGRRKPGAIIDLLSDNYLLDDGTWNYLTLVGQAKASGWANFGTAVATVGDVNLDGIDDFVVSAPLFDLSATVQQSGRVYVYFGSTTPVASMNFSDLIGYQGGFVIDGTSQGDFFGSSIANGFLDFNGDGYADILTSAPSRTTSVIVGGEATVIYGRCTTFPSNLPLRTGWTAKIGTAINGMRAGENFGSSTAAVGDLDNDGRTDLLIGAYFSNAQHGAAYLIFSC